MSENPELLKTLEKRFPLPSWAEDEDSARWMEDGPEGASRLLSVTFPGGLNLCVVQAWDPVRGMTLSGPGVAWNYDVYGERFDHEELFELIGYLEELRSDTLLAQEILCSWDEDPSSCIGAEIGEQL